MTNDIDSKSMQARSLDSKTPIKHLILNQDKKWMKEVDDMLSAKLREKVVKWKQVTCDEAIDNDNEL